ncbi:MAG TPA: DUF1887 family CARF protein [Bacteroidales bacterium]|nr:DUF1887 family CARF protein [Bacteroidales bacterium]HOR82077.1 DUF1887 family CARF protein [Bacteroidales bacterium]HPJ91389.1 DUF1887 family CARF protein [Bacteroidales bacterium]
MTYLISLLSEYLLPNFLLAKEYEGKYDRHIFITTRRMGKENMTSRYCYALGVDKKKVRIVVLSEEDLPAARQKLQKENFSRKNKYFVNLTGGTKIMSIAVFQHFYKYQADYFYVPIGMNKIENVRTGKNLPLNYRVNIVEYLSLYGLYIKTSETRYLDDDSQGEEFEKYVFNRIKYEKRLSPERMQIARGVKIFRNKNEKLNDNEIDVMWTEDNQLYVAECKVSLFKPKALGSNKRPISNPPEYLEEIMYKLSAISKDFGLRVNPYIFIKLGLPPKHFNEDRKKAVEKRMKILGIKGIISEQELRQQDFKI